MIGNKFTEVVRGSFQFKNYIEIAKIELRPK